MSINIQKNHRPAPRAPKTFYQAQLRQLHQELPKWSTQNYCAIRKYYETKLKSLGPSQEA